MIMMILMMTLMMMMMMMMPPEGHNEAVVDVDEGETEQVLQPEDQPVGQDDHNDRTGWASKAPKYKDEVNGTVRVLLTALRSRY